MSVNRYRPHLVVVMEDDSYRQLVNGAKLYARFSHNHIDARKLLGGWTKVLDGIDEEGELLKELRRFTHMHLLLLIDFDNQYDRRYEIFRERCQKADCYNRSFLLGIDHDQAEDLKHTQRNSFESLGKELVEGCLDPECPNSAWNEEHLRCNQTEIERMKKAGLFEWLFLA
uniref:DUF4276 family protein n=1 Tax=Desulfatirhabdium butyrativorans TaxID=340467 RepID=A0A7C4W7H2_9BACT